MSDLFEKVKYAIDAAPFMKRRDSFDMTHDVDAEARAAIRAVLAHFAEAGNLSQGMFVAFNKAWGEQGGTVSEAFAAAMAVALKEMEPKS